MPTPITRGKQHVGYLRVNSRHIGLAAWPEMSAPRGDAPDDIQHHKTLIRISVCREWRMCSRSWMASSIPAVVLQNTCPVMFIDLWFMG
eukprot:2890209-Pyramimonas_sp.AAC.1